MPLRGTAYPPPRSAPETDTDGDSMASDLLVAKLERYFRDPNAPDDILRPGANGPACANVRHALQLLGARITLGNDVFDAELENSVRAFQEQYNHRSKDGLVGPGTRRKLISVLLSINDNDPEIFRRLRNPEPTAGPCVFLSYSGKDSVAVDRLDQWLRNNGVSVIRDRNEFRAGITIEENIRRSIARADRVVVVYSANSASRDWPRLERAIAEELETYAQTSILIYLNLDGHPLPQHDAHRLAILAKDRPLKEVGQQLLQAVQEGAFQPPQYEVNEDEPLLAGPAA
jgi:hypothetical protein